MRIEKQTSHPYSTFRTRPQRVYESIAANKAADESSV